MEKILLLDGKILFFYKVKENKNFNKSKYISTLSEKNNGQK